MQPPKEGSLISGPEVGKLPLETAKIVGFIGTIVIMCVSVVLYLSLYLAERRSEGKPLISLSDLTSSPEKYGLKTFEITTNWSQRILNRRDTLIRDGTPTKEGLNWQVMFDADPDKIFTYRYSYSLPGSTTNNTHIYNGPWYYMQIRLMPGQKDDKGKNVVRCEYAFTKVEALKEETEPGQ